MLGGVQPPAYRALRSNSEDATPSSWFQRIRGFLTHYFSKVWRGGFRLSLNVTIFILGVLLLVGLFPHHVNHSYQTIINWTNPLPDDTFDLRIVVFGSQDLSGSAIDGQGDKERVSWTQRLCQEVRPTADSNDILWLTNVDFSSNVRNISPWYQALQLVQPLHPMPYIATICSPHRRSISQVTSKSILPRM